MTKFNMIKHWAHAAAYELSRIEVAKTLGSDFDVVRNEDHQAMHERGMALADFFIHAPQTIQAPDFIDFETAQLEFVGSVFDDVKSFRLMQIALKKTALKTGDVMGERFENIYKALDDRERTLVGTLYRTDAALFNIVSSKRKTPVVIRGGDLERMVESIQDHSLPLRVDTSFVVEPKKAQDALLIKTMNLAGQGIVAKTRTIERATALLQQSFIFET